MMAVPSPRATWTLRTDTVVRAIPSLLGLAIGLSLALWLLVSSADFETPPEASLSREDVLDAIAALEIATDLSNEQRERLVEQYDGVLADLAASASAWAEWTDLRASLSEVPGQIAAIRARLSTLDTAQPPVIEWPEVLDLSTILPLLDQEQAAVAAQEERVRTLAQGLDEESNARPQQRRELAELQQRIRDLDDELSGLRAAATTGPEAQARLWRLTSQRALLSARVQVLEQRLAGAELRRELAMVQQEEAEFTLDQAVLRLTSLQGEAERLRRLEAERVLLAAEAATVAVADAHPLIRSLAVDNTALAEVINAINEQTTELEGARVETLERLAVLEQDFDTSRQRILAAGLTRALGRVLLDQREQLPNLRLLRQEAAERANATADSTLAMLGWREELLGLESAVAARALEDELGSLTPAEATILETQWSAQRDARMQLLEHAIAAEERQLRALVELDLAAERLQALTAEYQVFLAEHLLWIRSHVPITQQSFSAFPEVIGEVLRPANWLAVIQVLRTGLAGAWTWWSGLLVTVLLLSFDRTLRRRIRGTAIPLRTLRTDRFGYTLLAIALTLLLAAPIPLLLAILGLLLTSAATSAPFPYAVGDALLRVAPGLFYLLTFRLVCMNGGLAEEHFQWRRNTLIKTRRALNLAIWILVPLGFLAFLVNPLGEVQAATVGRLALTAVTLMSAILLALHLHPRHGLVRDALASAPDSLASRLRHLWYPLAIAVPLGLMVLTLAGFQYTAGTLFNLWFEQFWLLLGLVLLHQSILRWLLVTRRRLALRQAITSRLRRDTQQRPASDPGGQDPAPETTTPPHVVDAPLDLVALDGQTRQLLNALLTLGAAVAVWILWSDMLPALNVLERVTLWSTSASVDGVTVTRPITLADLASIVVIIAVAVIAVRHLPALLEILLLQNTRISSGGRYTIIALTGYLTIAVAMLLVFGQLGLTWQQVQWLVAALGVGIGFGLQEIVANFISGLIILFERPVRVGDTVTIGEQSGVVTRIEMRATTIRTWDHRELLVPNKQLITGEVVNWTLSDQTNRGEILVSIDYGNDTEQALRILHEVVHDDPRVMTDPAPVITVAEFGERGLDLMVRFFLPGLSNRMLIRGELITAIDSRLRAAGIAIGRPQRDIWMREEGGGHATRSNSPEPGTLGQGMPMPT
ncbi:mechanosensitive ion channel domain-containing protein [Thiocapsa imhoffii]|nr:mechanosensitive ion channel domain-containing protein [Thiocapsa imhoffii]